MSDLDLVNNILPPLPNIPGNYAMTVLDVLWELLLQEDAIPEKFFCSGSFREEIVKIITPPPLQILFILLCGEWDRR